MASEYSLQVEGRSEQGKGASRRLRRENKVPAIIYGGGKDPQSITVMHNELIRKLEEEGFYSQVLTLHFADKKEKVILRDLQRHVYKPFVTHVDFQRVRTNELIRVSVALHLLGEDVCPGIRAGGSLMRNQTDVEVECLPADIPTHLEIDISEFGVSDVFRLSSLQAPEGVKFVDMLDFDELSEEEQAEQDIVLVSIQPPRTDTSAADDAELNDESVSADDENHDAAE